MPKFKDYKLNKITSSELQKWKQYIETCTNAKSQKRNFYQVWKQNIFGEFRALMNYAVKWNTYREILLLLSETLETHTKIKGNGFLHPRRI